MRETWNQAEISEDIKPVNYVNADSWNAAELNEAINLFGIEYPIDTWNPAELDEKARNIINDITSTKTIRGNPISFQTINGGYAKSCEVTMLPIQDLHGQSAPYPAGGGKNKLPFIENNQTSNGITIVTNKDNDGNIVGYTLNGTATGTAQFGITSNFTIPAGTYILNGCNDSVGVNSRIQNSGKQITQYGTQTQSTATLESDLTDYFRIRVEEGATLTNANYYPMLRLSTESDSTFAPYSNICSISGMDSLHLYQDTEQTETPETTHTATFPDTVYGGSYELVEGKQISNKGFAIYDGTEDWTMQVSSGVNTFRIAKPEDSSFGINNISNILPPSSTASVRNNSFYIGNSNMVFCCNDIASLEDWKTLLSTTNLQVAYELATPQEITLTPEIIELLKGNNTLWTDGDSIKLKYTKLALPEDSSGLSLDQKVRKAIEIIKGKEIKETKKSTTKGRRKKS